MLAVAQDLQVVTMSVQDTSFAAEQCCLVQQQARPPQKAQVLSLPSASLM